MMIGSVAGGNILLPITLRGFNEQEIIREAVVDTGFNGPLSLPIGVIHALGLFKSGQVETTLANGMMIVEDLYTALVVWDGVEQMVFAAVADPDILVGMELMTGYNLSVDVKEGGPVRLSRLDGELIPAQSGLESGI